MLDMCQALAGQLAIAERVIFHGARPHQFVRERMQRAAVFVQHSVTSANGDTEGLGVSLLEAMMSAVPVVATRHNGFLETVVDGKTGFLVAEHDVGAMAEKMRLLLEKPELRMRMGQAGRERAVRHFSSTLEIHLLRKVMGIVADERAPCGEP